MITERKLFSYQLKKEAPRKSWWKRLQRRNQAINLLSSQPGRSRSNRVKLLPNRGLPCQFPVLNNATEAPSRTREGTSNVSSKKTPGMHRDVGRPQQEGILNLSFPTTSLTKSTLKQTSQKLKLKPDHKPREQNSSQLPHNLLHHQPTQTPFQKLQKHKKTTPNTHSSSA
ncbi:hypothetical protein M758_9G084900 [Ceratodon purpureus]|nr:hypothetical protein M758_9G084900 [Ceratodon purpureus]